MLDKIKYLEWLAYIKRCNYGNYEKVNFKINNYKKVCDAKESR